MKALVQFDDISLTIQGQTILKCISFEIHQGQIITLLGPNGAGKTSLVRLLVGLQQPSLGVIKRQKELVVGYVPQQMSLQKSLPITVERFLNAGRRTSASQKENAIKMAQAEKLIKKPLGVLSGGERQRVLLARALLGSPSLLVLDEPMQGIDLQGQDELYSLLYGLQKHQDIGIFLVSHDLHIVMSASNHVMCLNKHLCCQGSTDQIQDNPAFLDMFGLKSADHLALYRHRHNHHHGFNQS